MKKALVFFVVAALMIPALALSASAEDNVVNLISEDNTWVVIDAGNGTATTTYEDGTLVVTSNGGWPCITHTFAEPIKVKADSIVNCDFELVSGTTSIRFTLTTGDVITAHHAIGSDINDTTVFDTAGDLIKPGSYSITDKALNTFKAFIHDGTAQLKDLAAPDENGYYYIDTVTIYAIGTGEVRVSEFTITAEAATEEPGGDESTGGSTPETGDGAIVFAIIALISCAGAFSVIKLRK